MASRPTRFRDRSGNRPRGDETFADRSEAEAFCNRSRTEARATGPFRRSNERRKESPDVRERTERRGRSRSRSRNRNRPPRTRERRSRSTGRAGKASRFEPPNQQLENAGFVGPRSEAGRRGRLGDHVDVNQQWVVEDGSNRFSPPVEQHRFGAGEEFQQQQQHHRHGQFDMGGVGYGQGAPGEVYHDGQMQLSDVINQQGQNQGFASQQGLVVNQMQPLVGKSGFLGTNVLGNPGLLVHPNLSMAGQGFPQAPSSFVGSNFVPEPNKLDEVSGEAPLIPEFNPETCKLSAHEWIRLLEQLAQEYDWKKDEKQYIMASRLGGFARQWYLAMGVNCKDFGELKQSFLSAFPSEMSFHALLQKMLARVKEDNETMAAYFHHKVALLNACEILGRKAVSCIIGGLSSAKHQQQASLKNCEDPDELYAYLRSCDSEQPSFRSKKGDEGKTKGFGKQSTTPTKTCFLCNFQGHVKAQCPQRKQRQKSPVAIGNHEDEPIYVPGHNGVMQGSLSKKHVQPKYFTDVIINGTTVKAYVDLTSECSTIREEASLQLKLPVRKQYKVVRGFGGASMSSVGVVDVPLCADRAIANVKLFVVPDHLQVIPVVVGQSFTKQPHVVVMKDQGKTRYFQRMDNGKTNFDF